MKPLYQELPFPIDNHIQCYVEDLPHFVVPWHFHPAIEIMYIEEGSGIRFVGDHIERYTKGDVCIIGPQLPHEWRSDKEKTEITPDFRSICFCVFFKREIFEPNLIRLPEMNNIRDLIERSRRGIKFSREISEQIAQKIKVLSNEKGILKITNLLNLLELMANTTDYELLASVGFVEYVDSDDFERFDKVYKYILRNFTEIIRIEDVAALVGLSPNAFCRYFKKRTKKTFIEYLNDIRIGYAKKLLIQGNMKISTICFEVGFNNLSNFITQFKKSTNMLPSDFQKMHNENCKDALL